MPFTVEDSDALEEHSRALAARLLPDENLAAGSPLDRLVRINVQGAVDNHAHISTVAKEIIPIDASEAMLLRWGALYQVPRKGATGARRDNALRLVGTPTAAFTIGDTLVHSSGLRYELLESGTIPPAGYVDVSVQSVDVGAETRLPAGETLDFETQPDDIEPSAQVVLDLNEGGEDVEPIGEYRARVLDRIARKPRGGAEADYEAWAREVAGVARAYVYPTRAGAGSVDVVGLHLGSGTVRILSSGETAALAAHIAERRPLGADVRVLHVSAVPVDVEVLVSERSLSYRFDWADASPPVVASWNASTLTLTLAAARPIDLEAGHRIVIKTAGGSGAAVVVESLPVTATQLVLRDAPSVAPVAGDLVYAGGPLTEPCRSALVALVDSLGPANPDGSRYGDWEGTLRPSSILGSLEGVAGVYRPQVVAPASDVAAMDPPYPLDNSIELLVARRMIVRRRWS